MPKVHELKTWPNEFQAVYEGRKPFEIRVNDRNYEVGDHLILREYNPAAQDYTGRACERTVLSILAGGQFGLDEKYVAMGLDTLDSPLTASSAIRAVVTERRRQIEAEKFTPDYDDSYTEGQLALAAAAYALEVVRRLGTRTDLAGFIRFIWPWSVAWWKPKDARRDLVRAAALMVAEIERGDRKTLKIRTDRTQGAL